MYAKVTDRVGEVTHIARVVTTVRIVGVARSQDPKEVAETCGFVAASGRRVATIGIAGG